MRDESLFFDEAKISAQAGSGGNGCVSFRREKFVPHGGPNGGHGGNGGVVVLVVNPHLNTLLNLRKHPHWKAQKGAHGQGSNKHGKNGADILVPVPRGTIARDAETGELIADLANINVAGDDCHFDTSQAVSRLITQARQTADLNVREIGRAHV
jgi:GTP-binding protein